MPALKKVTARLLAAGFAFASCFSNVPAHAVGPAADKHDVSTARALFVEATRLRDAGRWAAAADKLRQAIAIKDTPGLRFHLAHCEEKLGHLLEAESQYQAADSLIRGGATAPDVAELLDSARSELTGRIPTLSIHADSVKPPIRILVDGHEIARNRLSKPLEVDPGAHEIIADDSGHVVFRSGVTLNEGEDRVVRVSVNDAAHGESAPAVPEVDKAQVHKSESLQLVAVSAKSTEGGWGGREWVLAAEGLLAVGGLAAGVVLEVNRGRLDNNVSSVRSDIDVSLGRPSQTSYDVCADPQKFTQVSKEQNDYVGACEYIDKTNRRSARYGHWATASFIGAGVGAAAFVSTWFLWPSKDKRPSANVQFLPFPGGIAATGVF